jgi:PAS domain S-box-containing protein
MVVHKPSYEDLAARLTELEEKSRFYQLISDNSNDWESFYDKEGNLIYTNKAFENITGYSIEELKNNKTSLASLVFKEDSNMLLKFHELLQQHEIAENLQFRILTKDGTIKHLSVSTNLAFDNSRFVGTVSTIRDITEIKETNEKIRVQEVLKQSHDLMQYIIEHNRSAIAVHDRDLNYIFVSERYLKDYNVKEKDVIGKHHYEVFPDLPQKWRDVHQKALKGEISSAENDPYVREDGSIDWTRWECRPWYETEGVIGGIIVYTEVINRQKLIEQELAKTKIEAELTETKFKSYFMNSLEGIFLVNEKGELVEVNPAASTISGYSQEELCRMNIKDLTPDPEKDIVEEWYENIKNTGQYTGEVPFLKKDSSVGYWILSIVKLTDSKYLAFAKDSTEQYKVEDERRKSDARIREKELEFRKMSANVPGMIYQFTRKPDGKYCVPVSSEGLFDIFGCQPEDVIDSFDPIVRVIYPDDVEKVISDIEYSAKHLTYFKCEFRVHIPGRKVQWIYSNSSPEKLPDGSITWYGFNVDITERKRSEIELLKAKEKAEESDRLKTAFLQNMSHEVRTPLNAIVGFSYILSEQNDTDDRFKMFSNTIVESSNKLIGIISDVIEISEIKAAQTKIILSEVDVIPLISGIIKDFERNAVEKEITLLLHQKIPGNEFVIESDRNKLKRIFFHLIDNAVKFTLKGSVEITAEVENGNLRLTVADTGIGIPPDAMKIIFEPFRQGETNLSRNYGGNGLGLSIANAYTEMLNGSIKLESEVSKGTVVSVTLPVEKNNSVSFRNTSLSEKQYVETVLVAEDEYSNYLYIKELLENCGFDVIHASNGRIAVEICRNNPAVDLVLMDIKMPVMDGNTSAKLIKEIRPEIPIIAQTAYTNDSEIGDSLIYYEDFISKPIDSDEFIAKMKKFKW